jgi:C3HC zinc finger-like
VGPTVGRATRHLVRKLAQVVVIVIIQSTSACLPRIERRCLFLGSQHQEVSHWNVLSKFSRVIDGPATWRPTPFVVYNHSTITILSQCPFFARHRWRNVDKDMLCCTSCGELMALTLPSGLSFTAVENVCSIYRTNLAQAHKESCTFRLQAEQYMRQRISVTGVLPAAFANVFPLNVVELLEHPSPVGLLQERIAAIQAMAPQNQEKSPLVFPKLELGVELTSFLSNRQGQPKNMLDYIAEMEILGTDQKDMVALAVLGWIPNRSTCVEDSDGTCHWVVSFRCPLCLSDMALSLLTTGQQEGEDSSDSRKRRKKLAQHCNPHDAHRYYCPFICGFPSTIAKAGAPFWRVLLERLEEPSDGCDDEGNNSTAEITRIRAIIKSMIRPQKVELLR